MNENSVEQRMQLPALTSATTIHLKRAYTLPHTLMPTGAFSGHFTYKGNQPYSSVLVCFPETRPFVPMNISQKANA